jgi:hypothetical protein
LRLCGENGVLLGNGNRIEKQAHPFHNRQIFGVFRRRLQAMTYNSRQYSLEIFRQNQITAFEESPGPGTVQQCQSGAR